MKKLKIKYWLSSVVLLTTVIVSSCDNKGPPRVIELDPLNPEALLLSATSLPDGLITGLYVSDFIAYLVNRDIDGTSSLILFDILDIEFPVYLSQLDGLDGGVRLIPNGQFEPAGTSVPALSSTLLMPILSDGLITFDVSDAFKPTSDISLGTPGGILFDIAVTDTFRCEANTIDVTIVVTPDGGGFTVTSFPTIGNNAVLTIDNDANYCYSLEQAGSSSISPPQMRIFDPNDPGGSPAEIAAIDLEGFEIIVAGSFAYVLTADVGLTIVDISTPTAPSVISLVETPLAASTVNAISIDDILKRAYIATDIGIIIIDISDPFFPVVIGDFELFDSPLAVSANNGILYVTTTADSSGLNPQQLLVIDVSQF